MSLRLTAPIYIWSAAAPSGTTFRGKEISRLSKVNYRSDAFAFMHQVERIIDLFQREIVGNHRVDFNHTAQIALHVSGELRPPAHSAKGCAAPDPPGDELKWSCADFLAPPATPMIVDSPQPL